MEISVIIPVYNDPEGIQNTLDSLTSQTISRDEYEIIVVDNNSTDETPAVIESYDVTYLVEAEIQSSYAARNTGIEYSSAEILAFVDADMVVDDDWVESVLEEFNHINHSYMGCNVEVVVPSEKDTIWARFNKARGFPVEFYIEEMNFAPTCCLVVSKELVKDIGGFDQRLISGGDSDFGHRAADAGYEQYFAENIHMYHPPRYTSREMIKKAKRLGRGKAQQREIAGDRRMSFADIVPPHPVKYRNRLGDVPIAAFPLYYLFECGMKAAKFRGILDECVGTR